MKYLDTATPAPAVEGNVVDVRDSVEKKMCTVPDHIEQC